MIWLVYHKSNIFTILFIQNNCDYFNNFFNSLINVFTIFEFTVNGCKSYVCNFIQIFNCPWPSLRSQMFHFSCSHVIDLCLNLSIAASICPMDTGSLWQDCTIPFRILFRFVELSCLVFLDDTQRFCLYLLISCKTFSAFVTLSSSTDRIVVFCRSGIYDSGILTSTIWASHLLVPPCFYCLKYIIFFL